MSITEEKNSEFLEELKMNIRCDEDESHLAVLYCGKCEANLCVLCSKSLHSRKVHSNHVVVRLTEKPEPPIFCTIHPQRIAELVCKDLDCDGMNKPICIMCHQYETHKNHEYKLIDDEYDEIRGDIEWTLKDVEKEMAVCDKSLEYYEKCISSYSTVDAGFWKSRREEVDKLYSEARTTALMKFDNFTKHRIEKLNLSKEQYLREKLKIPQELVAVYTLIEIRRLRRQCLQEYCFFRSNNVARIAVFLQLRNISTELEKFREMQKNRIIENRESLELLRSMFGLRETMDEPILYQSAKCCTIGYPNAEQFVLKIDAENCDGKDEEWARSGDEDPSPIPVVWWTRPICKRPKMRKQTRRTFGI